MCDPATTCSRLIQALYARRHPRFLFDNQSNNTTAAMPIFLACEAKNPKLILVVSCVRVQPTQTISSTPVALCDFLTNFLVLFFSTHEINMLVTSRFQVPTRGNIFQNRFFSLTNLSLSFASCTSALQLPVHHENAFIHQYRSTSTIPAGHHAHGLCQHRLGPRLCPQATPLGPR